ncbi:MAG: hypothetical protein H7A46_01985 [Verrucomicrobiales bacterium]|nr:hypothetical protein [Verrucomicrobiales bacterium]
MRRHSSKALAAAVGLLGLDATAVAAAATVDDADAIRPWPANPFYWQYRGQPVFLAGGTDDDNLFQWPNEKLIPQLDLLAACGGNYVRNTMSDRQDKGFELYPFARRTDGRYDLDQWNDAYWDRFETFLTETEKRGIIVQIEVWDRFDYSTGNWPPHPYNPKNNVNYTAEESGLAAEYPDHPGRNRQPFFFTVPTLRNNETVFNYQRRFVDKMLGHALAHGNVLYCMDNETNGDPKWGAWWAGYLKQQAAKAGRTIFVTEMWDNWDLKSDEHRRTFDHPELYDFVDVSQNNHQKGQVHWDNFQWVRRYLAKRPRPINTVKTYGADGNKFGHTDQDGLERVWRHVLGGAAAVRFHRPDSGLGLSPKAQAALRSIRLLEELVKVWELQPREAGLTEREANEAYLAEAPGRAVVVCFTNGGKVKLDLKDRPGPWRLHWLDTGKAFLSGPVAVPPAPELELAAPGQGIRLAILTRAQNQP